MSEKPEELSYERALELLDLKLKELEDGDLPLDRALQAVDEARAYLKVCQDRLDQARQKIEVRAEPSSEPELEAR
jgi:exodeoxyribonuclease VII small subunit